MRAEFKFQNCNNNSAERLEMTLSPEMTDDYESQDIMVFRFKFKGNEFMPQTLIFNYYIFATRCSRPLILKYKRFEPSGWKDNGIFGNIAVTF